MNQNHNTHSWKPFLSISLPSSDRTKKSDGGTCLLSGGSSLLWTYYPWPHLSVMGQRINSASPPRLLVEALGFLSSRICIRINASVHALYCRRVFWMLANGHEKSKDLTGQTDWETDQATFYFYKEETLFYRIGPQDRKVDRSTLASFFRSHIESKIYFCYMLLKTSNSKKERVSSWLAT